MIAARRSVRWQPGSAITSARVGDVEPCPIIQFATENIRDNESIFQLMSGFRFPGRFPRPLRAGHARVRRPGASGSCP